MTTLNSLAGARVSYNGVDFGVMSNTKITARPVYDSINRAVKWVEYEVTVEGWLHDQYNLSFTMEDIRKKLREPGKYFHYDSGGFGKLIVNRFDDPPSDEYPWIDINNGPKPRVLQWKPLGGDKSCYVSWSCVVTLPECREVNITTADLQGKATEYVFSWTHDIDATGLSTSHVRGHLEMSSWLEVDAEDRVIAPVWADQYRSLVASEAPLGFQRMAQSFTLSEDHKRVDFSYTDRELPVPLPEGVSQCDIQHRLSWSLGGASGARAINTISGSITQHALLPKSLAYNKFWAIVKDRLAAAEAAKIRTGVATGPYVFTSFDTSEEMFGLQSNFSLSYWYIQNASKMKLRNIIQASGLWQPVSITSHTKYKTSMEATAWKQRGTSDLEQEAMVDVVVDLCHQPGD